MIDAQCSGKNAKYESKKIEEAKSYQFWWLEIVLRTTKSGGIERFELDLGGWKTSGNGSRWNNDKTDGRREILWQM